MTSENVSDFVSEPVTASGREKDMGVPAFKAPPIELWGAMRGTVKLAPGTDLTQDAGEDWRAEK